MTTNYQTHCGVEMRRSEMKKGHPWWCRKCGEYLERGAERPVVQKQPSGKITYVIRTAPPPPPVALRFNQDGSSIDGSEVVDACIFNNFCNRDGIGGPLATGSFKTKDGRLFSGIREDSGSEWELFKDD